MKRSLVPLAGAILATLVAAPPARADLITWGYSWSRSPEKINADAPGTGYIALSEQPLTPVRGDSDVVATNLRTFSTATPGRPDTFTAKAYTLALFLYDADSGQSATLPFTGQLDGTLTAHSANITNTFTGPTTREVVLGANRYQVTIGPYAAPGPGDGQAPPGAISAHATISVEPVLLPEPSALALAGLGLAALALARRRRRRR
jgi:hypothetical protein